MSSYWWLEPLFMFITLLIGYWMGWRASADHRSVSKDELFALSDGRCGDAFDTVKVVVRYLQLKGVVIKL